MFVGEVLAVTCADNLCGWIVTEYPGGIRDAHRVRLQRSRRLIHDQASDVATTATLQPSRHNLDVRTRRETCLSIEFVERALYKSKQIVAQNKFILSER